MAAVDPSVTYSLKYNARVLVPVTSDAVNSKWLVGTTALREENEVRLNGFQQLLVGQSAHVLPPPLVQYNAFLSTTPQIWLPS